MSDGASSRPKGDPLGDTEGGAEVIPLYPERDADRAVRVAICAEVIHMDRQRLEALFRWLRES